MCPDCPRSTVLEGNGVEGRRVGRELMVFRKVQGEGHSVLQQYGVWLVQKALGRRFAHFSAAPAASGAHDVWGKGQEDPSLKAPSGA